MGECSRQTGGMGKKETPQKGFHPAPDGDGLVFIHTAHLTDGRELVVGCYPTLFGMRIRAGYRHERCYHIDWCAGSVDSLIRLLYKTCIAILNTRTNQKHGHFHNIPTCSRIKPTHLDHEFMDFILQLEQDPVCLAEIPSFQTLRDRYSKTSLQ